MNSFEAIVLGAVQGITEFLPISSSGHLRIVPALFGWKDPGAAFTAVIQLGTMAAVLIYFRNEIVSRVQLSAPHRPVVSNVTGTWLRPDQATSLRA